MKIDFSTYSNHALEEALVSINREMYPDNYRAVMTEIRKRKDSGEWQSLLFARRALSFKDDENVSSVQVGNVRLFLPVVFLGIWLLFWFLISAGTAAKLLTDHTATELKNVIPLLGGLALLWAFTWMVAGYERLEISAQKVLLSTGIWQRSLRRREFLPTDIKGITKTWVKQNRGRYGNAKVPALQMATANEQIDFAVDASEEEIEQLLEWLKAVARRHGLQWKI